ncbi:winged helix-turn-helix domain-containing protein [Bacteroidota bacterium]
MIKKMAKKRERLEVIYDILSAIRSSNNSIKPTRLLYSSNLSPQMFKDYVLELLEKKFIMENVEKERKTYSLTTKGYNFLEEYKVIVGFIEDFGL